MLRARRPLLEGDRHGTREPQDRQCPLRPHARSGAPDHSRRIDPGRRRPDPPRRQGGRPGGGTRRPRDRRPPSPRHPGVHERPHAHQLRPSRPRHLPRRDGEPAEPRLQPAGGDDGGRGVSRVPARHRRAAEERDGVLRRSRQHEVPGRVPAGLRGLGHPRHHGRVRDRRPGALESPQVRHRRRGPPHRRVHRQVEWPARRPAHGVGHAVFAGDLYGGAAERAEEGGRRAADDADPSPQ